MKKLIFSFACFILINIAKSQTDSTIAISGNPLEMLFPQGKIKAVILSYDDGRTEDRQLVQLMNKYGLKGTFHLNSNKLGTLGYLNRAEIKQLFTGHEVSVHSANHPNLNTLSKIDVVYEIAEDRRALERLVGYPVRGMAYPFGNYNDFVIDVISGLGIEYARTVEDSYNFNIPANFLKWHPTIHQFGKAYSIPNNAANDQKELDHFYKLVNEFLVTNDISVLDVWGHSWELGNQSKWAETEHFFKLLANNASIHYTTQIDLVDYIHAFHNLKFSVDKNLVYNPGSRTISFKKTGKVYSVLPGTTIVLDK